MDRPSTAKVYATARGSLARAASPVAMRLRLRRHARFFALTQLAPGARVLDVGCGRLGLRALAPDLDITGADLLDYPDYPGPFVRADAAAGLPSPTGSSTSCTARALSSMCHCRTAPRSLPRCVAWAG